jgi:hypothetical protein
MGNVDNDPHADVAWSLPGKNVTGFVSEGEVVVRIGVW